VIISGQQATQFRLITLSGKEVRAGNFAGSDRKLIATGGLSHGVYLLQVQVGTQKMVKKVFL
jgi:hypothetical protein